jgi:hypothetical protein
MGSEVASTNPPPPTCNKGNVKKHESSKNGSTGATKTQMTASGSSNENTETEATTKTQMTASGNDKITW